MRINVYHEELTTETAFVETHVEETGKTYYGVRMFMKSAPELHHTVKDDDRTAITFWWGSKHAAIRHLELITESLRNDILQEAHGKQPLCGLAQAALREDQ